MTYNVTTNCYNSYVFTVKSGNARYAIEDCLESWMYDYDFVFKSENKSDHYKFTIACDSIEWNEWIKDVIENLIKEYEY